MALAFPRRCLCPGDTLNKRVRHHRHELSFGELRGESAESEFPGWGSGVAGVQSVPAQKRVLSLMTFQVFRAARDDANSCAT